MIEIICINSKFSPFWMVYFNRYGIKTPKEGELYTIRQVVNHTKGEKGLLLNELNNPETPKLSNFGGFKGYAEQDFAISRFTTLLGLSLTNELLNELKEDFKHQDKLVKIDKNNE